MAKTRYPIQRPPRHRGDPSARQSRQTDFIVNGEWRVDYVFEVQDGATVIAGIQITPTTTLPQAWPPAPGTAPSGGLTARKLREVSTGPKLIRAKARHNFPGVPQTMPEPRRPGSEGHTDEYYLDVADKYAKAVEAGSRRPVVDVADQLGYDRDYVSQLVREARNRNLLTSARHGVGEGQLTRKAKRLLAGTRLSSV